MISSFPKEAKFKFPWRKYQARILNELDVLINDDHLHIIAPPGSGKTILGLEVMLRINKPTLILAPTLTIRDQWVNRFCELFLQTHIVPDWISKDIKNPKFLTISTYQGLHASSENEDILKTLTFEALVLDEAHHLKKEWWKVLDVLKNRIKPKVVALTATPPYDVSILEWKRYLELNGDIDTEISIPELVLEKSLCPHQDYVLFTNPTKDEYEYISDHRKKIESLFQKINEDPTLMEALENCVIWINPKENLDWIYENIDSYWACLSFFKSHGREITKEQYNITGYENNEVEIPEFEFSSMEKLLNFYLIKGLVFFPEYKEHAESLFNRIRRYGAIDGTKISFLYNSNIAKKLTTSIGKLEGIKKIVDFEYSTLNKDLRLVILSDFIRDELLSKTKTNDLDINKIGVIPIFEYLRRDNSENIDLGVLSGSVVIIPKKSIPRLNELILKYGCAINLEPLSFDDNYYLVKQTSTTKFFLVSFVTKLFQEGYIKVLVGTKSLLGEGWDAPSINSLILASFVGSFVLSNQMRGRAIRSERNKPEKTGNIWHLACINPYEEGGGSDLIAISRRFKTFVGLAMNNDVILSNIERMDIPQDIHLESVVADYNESTFANAGKRSDLFNRWNNAISKGTSIVEAVSIKDNEIRKEAIKKVYIKNTIGSLFYMLITSTMFFIVESLSGLFQTLVAKGNIVAWFQSLVGLVLLYYGRSFYINLRLFIKYRDITKDIRNISKTLVKSLIKEGLLKLKFDDYNIVVKKDNGITSCYIKGSNSGESKIFTACLQEIIGEIDNPRYIIVRKNNFLGKKQLDYHSVPEVLGKISESATYLKNAWQHYVGKNELIYTRTIEGRKTLIKIQYKTLYSELNKQISLNNEWA